MNEFEMMDFACDLEPLLFDAEEQLMCHFDSDAVAAFLASRGIESIGSVELLVHHLKESPLCDETSALSARVVLAENIVPSGTSLPLKKEMIRYRGQVWVIHRYDKDPFPSSPHAHNYDLDLKMHLGNGGLYRGKGLLSTVRPKHLFEFRERVKHVVLPPLEVG